MLCQILGPKSTVKTPCFLSPLVHNSISSPFKRLKLLPLHLPPPLADSSCESSLHQWHLPFLTLVLPLFSNYSLCHSKEHQYSLLLRVCVLDHVRSCMGGWGHSWQPRMTCRRRSLLLIQLDRQVVPGYQFASSSSRWTKDEILIHLLFLEALFWSYTR